MAVPTRESAVWVAMMTTSDGLYIYLQRPDNGEWVTVGRYGRDAVTGTGRFRYAPSYLDAGLPWSIDPVNLPLGVTPIEATRYGGLHDVLRDACPDSWGQTLLQREHGLSRQAHMSMYLLHASNADRWGALAVGKTKKPSVSNLMMPKVEQLAQLSEELLAMYERRPAVYPQLRRRLAATPSMGGARPKATVQDQERYWLVKPVLPSDAIDIPLLEFAVQRWATASGMCFAHTEHHSGDRGLSVVRSLRFDRHASQRVMCLSAASLLQTAYPGASTDSWSYPALATVLHQIGAPHEDQVELFDRMVFNAIVGNDDDHPRNHAVHYCQHSRQWRLAPAFDVVPNPDYAPSRLTLQVCYGQNVIERATVLRDAAAFGLQDHRYAEHHLDQLIKRVQSHASVAFEFLPPELRDFMTERLAHGVGLLL